MTDSTTISSKNKHLKDFTEKIKTVTDDNDLETVYVDLLFANVFTF